MTFAGLTNKDGSFLVSRKKIDNFTAKDLLGKYVIGGRKGGMPEMTLEMALRENGIDPRNDLTIDTSITFAAMQGAFVGGTGDFVSLFEPNATQVERQGFGYVVASIGELGGTVPYTAYNAKKSFIEKNPKIIAGFKNAINKGLDYVNTHSAEEIANEIVSYFPDTSKNDLISAIDRYKKIEAWKKNTSISEADYTRLEEIMTASGELKSSEHVPYDKLFITD